MATPTTYVKLDAHVVSSETKIFSRTQYRSNIATLEESGTYIGVFDSKYTAATGGTTIDLSGIDDPEHMIIENLDGTNKVKVGYTSTGGACLHWLDAGDWMMTPGIDRSAANLVLTADTAAVDVRIIIITSIRQVPA